MSSPDFVFENRPQDLPLATLDVEGAIPAAVRGHFIANGSGQTVVGDEKLHAFDAHGRVLSAEFTDEGVTLLGKHVQTPLLAAERAKDAVVKRRVFSNHPSRWSNLFNLDFGNNCMHNAYAFGGHVVAAQDPGHFVLDPEDLSVLRSLDFGGLLKKGMTVTPMARVDPSTGHLVAWLQKPGPRDTITMVELDTSFRVVAKRACKLPAGLLHDVAFSKNYYLAIRFAGLNLPKVLWGAEPVASAFRFDEKYPVLHMVPKDGGAPRLVKLPNNVHFHFFNAFEDDDALTVYTTRYPGPVTFTSLYQPGTLERAGVTPQPTPRPEVVRYRISLATLELSETVYEGIAAELPAINPDYRGRNGCYGYAAAAGATRADVDPWGVTWFGALTKIDFQQERHELWEAEPGCVCSPPAFVADPARSGEDAGFLLSWVQDAERGRSFLAIFDAQDLAAGPVARAHTSELFGLISHTDFLPQPEQAPA